MMMKVYLVSAGNEFIIYTKLQYIISVLDIILVNLSVFAAYLKQGILFYMLSPLLYFFKLCIKDICFMRSLQSLS